MSAPRPPYGEQPPLPRGHEAYMAGPPAAVKRRRKWPWIVPGVVVVFILIGSLTSKGATPTPAAAPAGAVAPAAVPVPAAPAAATGHTVTYKVIGTGKATTITYSKEGFSQEQVSSAKLPFTKDLPFKNDVTAFSGVSIVAQNGAGSGDITCTILVDGREIASSTSSGQYAVVTCNGANA